MHSAITEIFVDLTWSTALLTVLLGFLGGTLSGFIGTGGAFFMTPGMMNLGVPGVVALASNITHKFGKAIVGARKHAQMGNVDKRLALFMLISAVIGVWVAVWINSLLVAAGTGEGAGKNAASDLYISAVFISILSVVAFTMLRDSLRKTGEGEGPSRVIVDFLSRWNMKPVVRFPVSDVEVSLWVLMPAGLVTGYLAGTIGVGGFVGVPSMIYLFGVPAAVAAGTELYLAIFMGAFGAINYAWEGFVDLRLTLLLFAGSLVGVYIGAYGVKVLSERMIRLTTAVIIAICVVSRAIAVPIYTNALGWTSVLPGWEDWLNRLSTFTLFAAGICGAGMILYKVACAYMQRRRIQTTLLVSRAGASN